MKYRKLEILAIVLVIILQTLISLPYIFNKNYIHMDEASAYGDASYDKSHIRENEDFFDTWHSGDYYSGYLFFEEGQSPDLIRVYKNQMDSTTPPLYFFILSFAMSFTAGKFSIWPGVIINMIMSALITLFLYKLAKRVFCLEKYGRVKAIVSVLICSVTLGTLSSVIFTGLHAMLTLIIIILAYLHVKLYENKRVNVHLLVLLGIVTFVGMLTSYYTFVFLLPMYILFLMRYLRAKDKKSILAYSFTLLGSILLAIAVFPFAFYNTFFGNLGREIVGTLGVQSALFRTLIDYVQKINHFGFNNMLLVIAILGLVCIIVKMRKPYEEKETSDEKEERKMVIKTILIPSLFYMLGVIAVSSWTELRHIAPVCGMLFILTIFGLYKFATDAFNEKIAVIGVCLLFVAMLVYPFISNSKPESTYADKPEVIEKIESEYNLPTVYILNTKDDRFLDDILLFEKLDNSYIAKDYDFLLSDMEFSEILEGQDLSNGILVVINNGQPKRHILDNILLATDFDGYKTLAVLNGGTVYYVAKGIEKEEIEDTYEDEWYESTMSEYLETATTEEVAN